MSIEQYIRNYAQHAQINSSLELSRFSLYIEEELDIYLQYLYGSTYPPCLRFNQSGGGYFYALPTALLQVDAFGEVTVIFDTVKHDSKSINQRLGGHFKGTPIEAIYKFALK